MSPNFQPFQVDYYNAQEGKPLDFFIYVPHGGKVADFLAAHPDLELALQVSRDKVEAICNLEEDTFTPELADVIAQILSAQSFRVAVMKVLIPREIVDVGRAKGLAQKPLYDFKVDSAIFDRHSHYYHQVESKRKELLARLIPEGKWLNLHSMRSFDDGLDMETFKRILGLQNIEWDSFDWEHFDYEQIHWDNLNWDGMNDWCQKRIDGLRAGRLGDRKHSLVAHEKSSLNERGELRVDPVLLQILGEQFGEEQIAFSVSDPYFFCSRMSPEQIHAHKNGILVDLVKEMLAQNPQAGLENLQADPEKIAQKSRILAHALIGAKQEIASLQISSAG